jgi:glycosyltransferase involved in cell wall biosynthesis
VSLESLGPDASLALSVVIPTRDRGSVIRRSVESALRSARPDVEVIVVDDGSSDDTQIQLSHVADDRFRYHRLNSPGNANRARNFGARLSNAPLIAFLDSDDAFGPDRIDRLIGFFSRWLDVDCLVDGYVEYSRGGVHRHRMPDSKPDRSELRYMLLAHLIPLTNSAITIRRSAFESVGGYDETMPRHQDRELLLRLAEGHSIWLGDEIDVEKHRMNRSLSHAYDGYIEGLDALAARFTDYHLPENERLFRYLIVRNILKALMTGHWPAALREFGVWRRATNLPKGYLRSLGAYRTGRRDRIMARTRH